MASIDQVEGTFADLIGRLDVLDARQRAMLPARRTIQATCTDLDASWHAIWRNGEFSEVVGGPVDGRPDIRIRLSSDDLVALAAGRLDLGQAVADGRVRLDASMTDLLRLRAVL